MRVASDTAAASSTAADATADDGDDAVPALPPGDADTPAGGGGAPPVGGDSPVVGGASSASGGAPPAGKVCARDHLGNSPAQPPAPHSDTTASPSLPPPSEKGDGVLERTLPSFDKAELEVFARDCAPAEGESVDSTHEPTSTVDLRDLVVRVFVALWLCARDEDLRAGGSAARLARYPPEEMIQIAAARCGSGLHLPEVRGLCGGFDHSLVCAWGWALTDLVGNRLSHEPVVSGGARAAARALESWGYTPRELHAIGACGGARMENGGCVLGG